MRQRYFRSKPFSSTKVIEKPIEDLNVQGLKEYCTHILFLRNLLEEELHPTKTELEKLCKGTNDEHSKFTLRITTRTKVESGVEK